MAPPFCNKISPRKARKASGLPHAPAAAATGQQLTDETKNYFLIIYEPDRLFKKKMCRVLKKNEN